MRRYTPTIWHGQRKAEKEQAYCKTGAIYLLNRLCTIDATIMQASVLKLAEEKEKNHIDFYPSRWVTWDHWKAAEGLDMLLLVLLTEFCDLLQRHIVGSGRFANF